MPEPSTTCRGYCGQCYTAALSTVRTMSYNRQPRADSRSPPDHIDTQVNQPLLDNWKHRRARDLKITSAMGFKALLGRTAFFRQHAERSPLERDLVRRLDIFLMTFGCVSQVIKYLDQTNISSAYVSGMKEDLNLYGNELNYFTTWFSVSYCIMLIPSQVIMTWVRPSWWLPGLEIGWGIITGLIALCHNANQVYVLRVFLGLFESSAWPGMMTLFSKWLSRRFKHYIYTALTSAQCTGTRPQS